MVSPLPPDEMTPAERLTELASILAAGLLRLRRCPISATEDSPESSRETPGERLDLPAETVLSVERG